MDTSTTQEFSQGARCGHLEGKGRAGSYVAGEETELAWEAAYAQRIAEPALLRRWASGYEHGYRLAAEGSDLEDFHKENW